MNEEREEKATLTMTIPYTDPVFKLAVLFQRAYLEHRIKVGDKEYEQILEDFNKKFKGRE